MTFSIPSSLKDLNSLTFDLLMPVELNDTSVDRMLTQIVERAIKQGRTAPSKVDPTAFADFRTQLLQSGNLQGFDDARGVEIVDGWLRTSVVSMATIGRRRLGEQMDYVRPITVACYRSGLPKSRSRHRKADAMVYRAIVAESKRHQIPMAERRIAELFLQALGRGVDVGHNPWADPHFDGHTDLDVGELLALRFLEQFPPSRNPSRDNQDGDRREAVPGAVEPIGSDLYALLSVYGGRWSPMEMTSAIAALTALRLFQLPIRMGIACRALLEGQAAPDVTSHDAPNPAAIYCDFTRRRGGPSDELARQCVARDLERLRTFFTDRLLLRSVWQAALEWEEHEGIRAQAPPDQLRELARLVSDREINASARRQLHRIEQELEDSPAGQEGKELIANVRVGGINAVDQLAVVLVEGLRKRGLENQVKWFWTTGGLVSRASNRPYALLDGVQGSRTTWRYAPGEELITVLLAMSFIEDFASRQPRARTRMPIAELLDRLERRYGVLIARPPAELDSADARAGAEENLDAFRRQLQLLGCFSGLSDDFSAQYVTQPRT